MHDAVRCPADAPPWAPPAAHGRDRVSWSQLPDDLRCELEAVMGTTVVAERSVRGGFGPALASVLDLADGDRVFLKLADVATQPFAADLLRAESRVAVRLPDAVAAPALRWGHEDAGTVALAFDVVDGAMPGAPWEPGELTTVLGALDALARVPGAREMRLPPTGSDLAPTCTGWSALLGDPDPDLAGLVPWAAAHLDDLAEAERGVLVACEGESLVHGDVRADNVLVGPGGATLVDWPYASRGAGWLDTALLLPSVGMQGVRGVVEGVGPGSGAAHRRAVGAVLDDLFTGQQVAADVHPADLRSVVAGVAGYFLHSARLPEPDGLANLRPFQRAQGVAAVAWLEHLGL